MGGLSVRGLLFTDIEGSTTLVTQLGDRYREVLERHHSIIVSAVTDESGVEQSREGDSMFITFPSATAALRSAVAAQRALEREAWPADGRVRVRMGVHVGEVAESRAGLVGLAIHQAARIMSAGHGGQILVSEDVVRQAAPPTDVSVRPLGTYDLRGTGQMALAQIDHPDLRDDFPQPRTNRALAHNLPAPLTSLVGRGAETDLVTELLAEHRLVTLLGEGGSGKTRLALAVAAAALDLRRGGSWFVELAPLPRGADVTSRVAESLGVQGGLDAVLAALEDRDVLLVLDNCEHVLESVSDVAASILRESPTAVILATSRAPLEVGGEVRYHVPPLALPADDSTLDDAVTSDAVQLFVARAALVRPGFRVGGAEATDVIELCRRLGGLPLAIELAAARLRAMSLGELVARIDDQFGLLVGGPRSAPARQQTLRNTMEWTFRLLDDDERDVLRHLCAFRGGADAEGTVSVCKAVSPEAGHVLDLVARLVDRSLVAPLEVDGSTRYHVHQLVREYAVETLTVAEAEAIAERHARWCGELGSRLEQGPAPGAERNWIRRHDVERDNLRSAADWLLRHDPPAALRLLVAVEPGVDLTPHSSWWSPLVRATLPLARDAPPGDQAYAMACLAWEESDTGVPGADERLATALELIDDDDDAVLRCQVLATKARLHADATGGFDIGQMEDAIRVAEQTGHVYWQVMIRYHLSQRAPPAVAESLSRDALRIAETQGFEFFASLVRTTLACTAQFTGESERALAAWRSISAVLDDVALCESDNAAFYSLAEGEHDEVAVGLHLAEHFALELQTRPHDPRTAAGLDVVIAHLRRLDGDLDGASAALAAAGRVGPPAFDFLGALTLVTGSAVARQRGDPYAAAGVIANSIRHVGNQDSLTDVQMRVVEELAAVAFALDRQADAADLLATARSLREQYGKPLVGLAGAEVEGLQVALRDVPGTVVGKERILQVIRTMAASG